MTTPPTIATHAELVGRLLSAFGRFRRQVGRIAGRSFDQTDVSASQAEFLRLVGRNPDISVKSAAAEMGLAPNSVSTFVTALVKDGLLLREPDPADRRVMRLSLPAHAQRTADETRKRRHGIVATALDELTSHERDQLIHGLAVIDKLTGILHEHEQGRR